MNKKILVGIPPKNHIILALDEIEGLNDLGFHCKSIVYGRNNQSIGAVNKLAGVIINAFKLVYRLYRLSPGFLYLNSRFEPVATSRDFITLLLIRLFYIKPLKIIIKTHGSDPSIVEKTSFFYRRMVLPFVTANVDAWLFLSSEERDIIRRYNVALADKIHTTSNIIDPSRSVASPTFRQRHGIDGSKFNVLFVGRIVDEKGVFEVLKSIPLTACRDACSFIFVGDGPDFEQLKDMAGRMGLHHLVQFPGFIPDEECDHFYANTDLLVFPTYFNEGFPMALFKSIAAGLPVVTTKTRAAIDHLSSPENVIWVDAKAEDQVAKAVDLLYNNQSLRAAMSANNLATGKEFTRRKVCAAMSEVFMALNGEQFLNHKINR